MEFYCLLPIMYSAFIVQYRIAIIKRSQKVEEKQWWYFWKQESLLKMISSRYERQPQKLFRKQWTFDANQIKLWKLSDIWMTLPGLNTYFGDLSLVHWTRSCHLSIEPVLGYPWTKGKIQKLLKKLITCDTKVPDVL